jgi:hypothetical protein
LLNRSDGLDDSIFFLSLLFLLATSLLLMVDTKVAVFADAFGIECAVAVFAFSCELCAALGMITIFAHSVGVVLLSGVGALRNNFSMLLEHSTSRVADLAILRGLLFTLRILVLMRTLALLLSGVSLSLLLNSFA